MEQCSTVILVEKKSKFKSRECAKSSNCLQIPTKIATLTLTIFFILALPVRAGIFDAQLVESSLVVNYGETRNFTLILVKTNESINLSIPMEIKATGIFPLTISPANFNLFTNSAVNLSLIVPSNKFPSGNYLGTVILRSGNETKELNYTLFLNESRNFTAPQNVSMGFNQSQEGYFYIPLKNIGNVYQQIVVISPDYFLNNSIGLPIDAEYSLPIFYKIPSNVTPNNYNWTFTVNGRNLTLFANISDTTFPVINYTQPKDVYYGISTNLSAFCTDNQNVSSFYFLNGGTIHPVNETLKSTYVGKREITLVCNDSSGNQVEKNISYNILPIEIGNYCNGTRFYTKRTNQAITQHLFNLSLPADFSVYVEGFEFYETVQNGTVNGTNGTVPLYVNLSREMKIYVSSDEENTEVSLNSTKISRLGGNVSMVISQFSGFGEYKGTLVLLSNQTNTSQVRFDFSGKIADYSIPNPEQRMFFGAYWMNQTGIDMGSYEQSLQRICVDYPISANFSISTAPIPVKGYEMDMIYQNFTNTLANSERIRDEEIAKWHNIAYLLGALALVILAIWRVPPLLAERERVGGGRGLKG